MESQRESGGQPRANKCVRGKFIKNRNDRVMKAGRDCYYAVYAGMRKTLCDKDLAMSASVSFSLFQSLEGIV